MIDINKEAEEYADYSNDYVPLSFGNKFNENTKRTFIAGHNSKATQVKILQAQLSCLNRAKDLDILTVYKEIQQQLKQLEDE